MPRKPRFFLAGVPVHVVQRGNNRQPVFFNKSDYREYLRWLAEAAEKYQCSIHAYVLMTNHIHLLVTPQSRDSLSRMLQYVGRRYVPYVNATYERTGTLWEGRFKASLIDADAYLLTCYRYIELNPIRAGLVKKPGAYIWSSYRCNALGKADTLVQPHPLFLGLGADEKQRLTAYRRLFKGHLQEADLGEVRACLQTGTPMGNDRFRTEIESVLGVKVGQSRRGRPRKNTEGT